jgi:hypothetical protein
MARQATAQIGNPPLKVGIDLGQRRSVLPIVAAIVGRCETANGPSSVRLVFARAAPAAARKRCPPLIGLTV